MNAFIKLLRIYFSILTKLSPELAGNKAFKLMQKPRRLKYKPAEKAFYDKSHRFTISSEIGNIPCYEVGEVHNPLVFLVHGWESNAGSMSGIGDVLTDLGYHVISFDLPAHGNQKAKRTNLANCQKALEAVIKRLNPSGKFSIVAHSFGSAVSTSTLAKKQYDIDHLILLSTPNELIEFFEPYRKLIGIDGRAYQNVLKRVELVLNDKMEDLRLDLKMQKIQAEKVTIIHDEYDRVLPFANAEAIRKANSKTKLIPIQKAGHYRMLWNDIVLQHVQIGLS